MAAAIKNLLIEQGATYLWDMTLLAGKGLASPPMNLTGVSLHMQIRPDVDSETVLLDLTSNLNGGITILPQSGATLGRLLIEITDEQTAALSFEGAVYDLELVQANGRVIRLYKGSVSLDREVTRP